MNRGHAGVPEPPRTDCGHVVIIGAGHDTAAQERQERRRQHGYTVEIHDQLDLLSPRTGLLLRETYRSSLDHAAWARSLVFHSLGPGRSRDPFDEAAGSATIG